MLKPALEVPDLDVAWRDVEYCVVDVETTGLDLRRDTLISFGSVLVKSGRVHVSSCESFEIKPSRPISIGAMTVHGLREQDLDDAPELGQVTDRIVAQLDGRVLVAHAAWVERAFLTRPLRAARRRWKPAVVDTAALLRATGLAPSGTGYEPDIEVSAKHLGLCVHTPHQALGDALTTGEVFLALTTKLEQQQPGLTAHRLVAISDEHTLT
ncbi:3'-5' exonuclease [Nocardioides mangrovicus]|uniref:3'-5' exonuclease n=1 Tax=Nocardioides mangrovicus TaxID=2478913 RepID=A0A3L8P5Y2_9ACTN|nr:3'-5' exonuclease [Nocardioides mangrovicus]